MLPIRRVSYQLYTQFGQATCRITDIIFETKELATARLIVAGIVEETSLEEGYVDEGRVEVHELEKEYLKRVRILVVGVRAWILQVG